MERNKEVKFAIKMSQAYQRKKTRVRKTNHIFLSIKKRGDGD